MLDGRLGVPDRLVYQWTSGTESGGTCSSNDPIDSGAPIQIPLPSALRYSSTLLPTIAMINA